MRWAGLVLVWVAVAYAAESDYTGSVDLDSKLKLWWRVDESAGMFYCKLQLQAAAWIGFGIGEQTSGSMPGADIVTAIWSGNDVVVTDRWALTTAMPTGDTCQDWKLVAASQTGGVSVVELSRKLNTGDTQDRPIPPGTVRIVWAYGSSNDFRYHGPTRKMTGVHFYGPTPPPPPTGEVMELHMANFQVPPQVTTYVCQSFELPSTNDYHVIQVDPIIDPRNVAYLHHFLLHVCIDNEGGYVRRFKTPGRCESPQGNPSAGCYSILYVWTAGSGSIVFPPEAGFRLGVSPGTSHHVVLEVHYNNPQRLSNIIDASGVRIHHIKNLRQYDAGVIQLGDPLVSNAPIPAGLARYEVEQECPPEATRRLPHPVTLFANSLHMHTRGYQMYTTLWRGTQFVRELTRADFFSYDAQQISDLNVVVQPGDRLNTHCVFSSERDTAPVRFGVETSDEMCMDFLFYYPLVYADPVKKMPFTYCGQINFGPTRNDNWTLAGGTDVDSGIIYQRNPMPGRFDPPEWGDRKFGKPGTCAAKEDVGVQESTDDHDHDDDSDSSPVDISAAADDSNAPTASKFSSTEITIFSVVLPTALVAAVAAAVFVAWRSRAARKGYGIVADA